MDDVLDHRDRLKYQEKTQYCPHPFTDFGVLWNGDVSLCCLDHDATLKVGDVRNHSIETRNLAIHVKIQIHAKEQLDGIGYFDNKKHQVDL